MTTPIVAILCAFMLAFTALVFFGGAYVYFRGKSGASPLPPAVEKFVNPPAKPEPEPAPEIPPAPRIKCPSCHKDASWKVSTDLSAWKCQQEDCGFTIPGPRARVRG